MRVEAHPAFILHRRPYRETSLLLDVFSRDYGRIGLVARGVRKKRSIQSEILQPFQRLQLAWSGRGELMTLTTVEADGTACLLMGKKLMAGFYLNELVTRMLHQHESHADLFANYDNTLVKLSSSGINEQIILRIFEKRLLNSIGYGLVLDQDVTTGRSIDPECNYLYQIERGPSVSQPETDGCIRVSGKALIAMHTEQLAGADILRETKLLMRFVLANHLGGRPLSSRELYKHYRNKAGNSGTSKTTV